MKLIELSTRELREAILATERVAGRDSPSARVLRRELARREAEARTVEARPERKEVPDATS